MSPVEFLPLCIEVLLDVQISNEISKWYMEQSELLSVDSKNSTEFLYQL